MLSNETKREVQRKIQDLADYLTQLIPDAEFNMDNSINGYMDTNVTTSTLIHLAWEYDFSIALAEARLKRGVEISTRRVPPRGKKKRQTFNDSNIPHDLDEAIKAVLNLISTEDQMAIKNGEINLPMSHHGFGTSLRNGWGLWNDSVLAKWFQEQGIYHADDMSGIILESTQRYLRGEARDLEGQIKYYQDFWKEKNQSHVKMEAE